jgi:hypothetical protein
MFGASMLFLFAVVLAAILLFLMVFFVSLDLTEKKVAFITKKKRRFLGHNVF